MHNDSAAHPWYKEFWAWFIIGILMCSVILGTTMAVTAFRGADTLVVSNYYDAGKGINQSLEREKFAERLGMRGKLNLRNDTGAVEFEIEGNSRPQLLALNLISPTQAEKDRRIVLQPTDSNLYQGILPDQITGRRFVEILGKEGDKEWRLFEEEELAPGQVILLGN